MLDHEGDGAMDNNLSLSDVTTSPDFFPAAGNDIAGQTDDEGEAGYGLVASHGTNPSLCNINITLFHNYIKSKKMISSYGYCLLITHINQKRIVIIFAHNMLIFVLQTLLGMYQQ